MASFDHSSARPVARPVQLSLLAALGPDGIVAEYATLPTNRACSVQNLNVMAPRPFRARRALDLLGSRRNDAYEAALAALREDTQAWWADTLAGDPDEPGEGEEPASADVEGLRRFLEGEVLPWFENRKKELANRPLIRGQTFGEALDPDKLERLGRYEVHLDLKLERMLTMLLRLKDLRQQRAQAMRIAKADS